MTTVVAEEVVEEEADLVAVVGAADAVEVAGEVGAEAEVVEEVDEITEIDVEEVIEESVIIIMTTEVVVEILVVMAADKVVTVGAVTVVTVEVVIVVVTVEAVTVVTVEAVTVVVTVEAATLDTNNETHTPNLHRNKVNQQVDMIKQLMVHHRDKNKNQLMMLLLLVVISKVAKVGMVDNTKLDSHLDDIFMVKKLSFFNKDQTELIKKNLTYLFQPFLGSAFSLFFFTLG